MLQRLGEALARYLTRPRPTALAAPIYGDIDWQDRLAPCDVLLIDGSSKVSAAIKYLTQSTWSHSALYVGAASGRSLDGEPAVLIEADMREGVRAVPLSKYEMYNVRICRPVRLTQEHAEDVVNYAVAAIGRQYDLRNVIDLLRYLLPEPPIPRRFRRRMMALGSGEPTRAICSTLIAQAFQSVSYPIMPEFDEDDASAPRFRRRHHSFITPRDFDLSPYFAVIKPTLSKNFDYLDFPWSEAQGLAAGSAESATDRQ